MTDDFDFGFSTIEPDNTSEVVQDRMNKVKNLITPFLNNLAKDPHKDIHWPNRDKKIAEFKKKLFAILDGEDDGI